MPTKIIRDPRVHIELDAIIGFEAEFAVGVKGSRVSHIRQPALTNKELSARKFVGLEGAARAWAGSIFCSRWRAEPRPIQRPRIVAFSGLICPLSLARNRSRPSERKRETFVSGRNGLALSRDKKPTTFDERLAPITDYIYARCDSDRLPRSSRHPPYFLRIGPRNFLRNLRVRGVARFSLCFDEWVRLDA